MNKRLPRWLVRNLSTLLLAFILALIVWVSAVTSADPNEAQTYQISMDTIGLDSDLRITSNPPERVNITLFAPRSILDQITNASGSLQVWMDLSELGPGTHNVPIQYQVNSNFQPVRVESVEPVSVELTLELVTSESFPIQKEIIGEPTLGYQAGFPEWSHDEVTVSGRASFVDQVASVRTTLNINGVEETVERNLKLTAYDEAGRPISDVSLTPSEVTVVQPITLKGGYRNMVIKVVTEGQVADGFRQTSISVSPPNVMVFSEDPNLVDQMPGYVETMPLDISGAVDDIETGLPLNLPEGISIVGDPNVLVQVGIAAMEGNLKLIRVVEIIGVLPEYQASAAPQNVEVILFGPIPVLDSLTESDVRVKVDVTGLEMGIHQLEPELVIIPERVQAEAITPGTIEVEITEAESSTPHRPQPLRNKKR